MRDLGAENLLVLSLYFVLRDVAVLCNLISNLQSCIYQLEKIKTDFLWALFSFNQQ